MPFMKDLLGKLGLVGRSTPEPFGDVNVVDIISLSDSRKCGIELFIIEKVKAEDEGVRYQQLVQKLRTYVGYVMSESFAHEHPKTKPTDVVIHVLYASPPNAQMKDIAYVLPKGDRVNRIQVIYQDYDTFVDNPSL